MQTKILHCCIFYRELKYGLQKSSERWLSRFVHLMFLFVRMKHLCESVVRYRNSCFMNIGCLLIIDVNIQCCEIQNIVDKIIN